MHHLPAVLSSATLLVVTAAAQCALPAGGTQVTTWAWTYPNDDGISTNHVPLGFNFPIAGAAAATFSSLRVGSNGWVMLTDGVNSTGLPGNTSYGSIANSSVGLGGAVGNFPMVAPFWGDLFWTAATSGVFVTNNPGLSCKVSWVNVRDYNSSVTGSYSFAIELFVTGEVRLHYDALVDNKTTQFITNHVGISCRNGVAIPSASDLFPNLATAVGGMLFQTFAPNVFDGAARTLIATPVGAGWVTSQCLGAPASTTSYGSGCYAIPATGFYELHADAALAATALTGNAMRLVKTATGYSSVWLPGMAAALFLAPTGAAVTLPLTDNGNTVVTPSSPLPTPAGPATQLNVGGNGIVTIGTIANNNGDWTPSGAEFAGVTRAGFYSWHDYNVSEAGSGQVKREEVGGVLCITYDGVESYSNPPTANRSTLQCQLDLTSGNVTWVWLSIDGNTTSALGSSHLVGVRGLGAITDGGSQVLSAGPRSNLHNFVVPLALASAPTPIFNTTITYTTSNIPETSPGSGLYLAMHILSLGQSPGLDLGFLGAPGCSAYVTSLDLTMALVGATPSQANVFSLPPAGPVGFQLFAQSVALIAPNSLPNGQNTFGLVTSNGIAHTLNGY
jgi:hypothetical protein